MSDHVHKYTTSPDAVKKMLIGGGEFIPPERLLGDLTESQALSVLAGSSYSIAGLVAHMRFWQDYNVARARGEKPQRPEHLDDTFSAPQMGEWKDLRSSFLAGLETCGEAAAEHGSKTNLDRDDTDIAYSLAECPALHSTYHYGQISMLRQIQGWWPPEGGDDSW